MLAGGCDRQAAGGAQEQGALPGAKASLAGEVDESFAGERMPAVNVRGPDGEVLNLGALEGMPVLLNLWATWCAPCVEEMPLLDELAGDYSDSLKVLTVSQDLQGAEVVEPFFAARDFADIEPWIDPDNQLGFVLAKEGLPVTVLYDANGREVWRVQGGYDWSSAEAREFVEAVLVR